MLNWTFCVHQVSKKAKYSDFKISVFQIKKSRKNQDIQKSYVLEIFYEYGLSMIQELHVGDDFLKRDLINILFTFIIFYWGQRCYLGIFKEVEKNPT